MLQIVRRFGLPFLLIALLPTIAWSGDEDLLLAEIPTVYAASRHEQPVTEAPAAVTVITRDDIVKYAEPCSPRRCTISSLISASAG
jgi:outer membrane cobalamin receptor